LSNTYTVYAIIERPDSDDFWLKIGLRLRRRDGTGFDLMLGSFSLSNKERIVLLNDDARLPDARRPKQPTHGPRISHTKAGHVSR
jgi:hypothetical protein